MLPGSARGSEDDDDSVKNGTNLASVMSIQEMCWGDVGLLLSMPRQGLGNSAIASVADDEQLARFDGVWAGMAITEPGHRLRLREHQDDRRPRRRRVRPQRREDLRHLRRPGRRTSWCGRPSTRSSAGRRSSRSWSRRARRGCASSGSSTSSASAPPTPRRSSSRTAGCRRRTSSGSAEVDPKQGFAGAMATFDNTRPLVAVDGRRLRVGRARPDPRAARARRGRGRLRPSGVHPVGGGREVPPDRVRPARAPAC